MKKETEICFLIDFLFVLALIFIALAFFYAVPFLWPLFTSFLLSFIFLKLSGEMKKVFHLENRHAAIISALLFYIVVALISAFAVTKSVKALMGLSSNLPSFLNSLSPLISSADEKLKGEAGKILLSSAGKILTFLSQTVLEYSKSFIKDLPVLLSGLIFTILSSFYIATDYPKIKRYALKVIPSEFHFFITFLKDFFNKCIGKLAKAYLILMIITFLELSAGFFILKIKSPLKLSLIISLLDILPLIGTGAVLFPWGILKLIAGEKAGGLSIILLASAVTVIRNILEPHLIGKELGLNPILSLTACFLGLKLFGIAGVFIFPLIFLFLKYLFSERAET